MEKLYKVILKPGTGWSIIGKYPVGDELTFNTVGQTMQGEPHDIYVMDDGEDPIKPLSIATSNRDSYLRSSKVIQLLPLSFIAFFIQEWNAGRPITEVKLGKPTSANVSTILNDEKSNDEFLDRMHLSLNTKEEDTIFNTDVSNAANEKYPLKMFVGTEEERAAINTIRKSAFIQGALWQRKQQVENKEDMKGLVDAQKEMIRNLNKKLSDIYATVTGKNTSE